MDDLQDMAGGDGVSVHAGFPNPAAERRHSRQELALNLNQLLIRHPSSTYLFRMVGNEWVGQGIFDGDIALIDRAISPRGTDLVIAWQNDSFTLCKFKQLLFDDLIWGVVIAVIHRYRS